MPTYGSLPIHGLIALHPSSSRPLYQQLYESVRAAILAGQLAGGTRLPSTRALAQELGASRSTVINAFDQLLAEGYIYGLRGSGTYVARVLPEELLQAPITPAKRDNLPGAPTLLLKHCGHLPQRERPRAVLHFLRMFAARLAAMSVLHSKG